MGIVESDADYDRILPHLYPPTPVDTEQCEQWAREQEEGNVVLWFTAEGFFWFPRTLLGIERHLYTFYDQPELMHSINSDLADWILLLIDQVCAICTPAYWFEEAGIEGILPLERQAGVDIAALRVDHPDKAGALSRELGQRPRRVDNRGR
ncbi:MAG: hypothetical protein E4H02_13365 [Lentisphaerales bacterium]|nr:MAG: hypothetical protein E4H02_13365 [Lentisphaerales bacterium]